MRNAPNTPSAFDVDSSGNLIPTETRTVAAQSTASRILAVLTADLRLHHNGAVRFIANICRPMILYPVLGLILVAVVAC